MASRIIVRGPILQPRTPTDKRRQKVDQLTDVDHVPTNAHSSGDESQLYIFENNEAVLKLTIKKKVQRQDTCQEPTKLHLIGCSTELIENPRSK